MFLIELLEWKGLMSVLLVPEDRCTVDSKWLTVEREGGWFMKIDRGDTLHLSEN